MTDRELSKLKRTELLEMMINQGKMVSALQQELEEEKRVQSGLEHEKQMLEDSNERLKDKLNDKDEQILHLKEKLNDKDEQFQYLKEKLDDKDEQIQHLKEKLDGKDEQLQHLKKRLDRKDDQLSQYRARMQQRSDESITLENAGSIASEALRLNGVFEAAQAAADQYLASIRQLSQRMTDTQPDQSKD